MNYLDFEEVFTELCDGIVKNVLESCALITTIDHYRIMFDDIVNNTIVDIDKPECRLAFILFDVASDKVYIGGITNSSGCPMVFVPEINDISDYYYNQIAPPDDDESTQYTISFYNNDIACTTFIAVGENEEDAEDEDPMEIELMDIAAHMSKAFKELEEKWRIK